MSEPRPTPVPEVNDVLRKVWGDIVVRWNGMITPRLNYPEAADLLNLMGHVNEAFRAALSLPSPDAAALPASAPVVRQVGCEDSDGLLHLHPESETCEVCKPTAAAPLAPALSETE